MDAPICELCKQCEMSLNTSISVLVEEFKTIFIFCTGLSKAGPLSYTADLFASDSEEGMFLLIFCVYFVNYLLAPVI